MIENTITTKRIETFEELEEAVQEFHNFLSHYKIIDEKIRIKNFIFKKLIKAIERKILNNKEQKVDDKEQYELGKTFVGVNREKIHEENTKALVDYLSTIDKKNAKKYSELFNSQDQLSFDNETFQKIIRLNANIKEFLDEYIKASFANYLYTYHKNIIKPYLGKKGFSNEEIENLYSLNDESKKDYVDLNKKRIDLDFTLLFFLLSYSNCNNEYSKRKLEEEIIVSHFVPKLRNLRVSMGEDNYEIENIQSGLTVIYLGLIKDINKSENPVKVSNLFRKIQPGLIKYYIKDLKREDFKYGVTEIPKFYRSEKLLCVAKYLTNQILIKLNNNGYLVNGKLETGLKELKMERFVPKENIEVNKYNIFLRDYLNDYLKEKVDNSKPSKKSNSDQKEITLHKEIDDQDISIDKENNTEAQEPKPDKFLDELRRVLIDIGFKEFGIDISEVMLNHLLTQNKFSVTYIDEEDKEQLRDHNSEKFNDQNLNQIIKVKKIFHNYFVINNPKFKDSVYKLAVFFMKYIIGTKQKDCALSLNIGNDSAVMNIDYKLNADLILITDPNLENFVSSLLNEHYSLIEDKMDIKEIRSVLSKFLKGNYFTTDELQEFSNSFLNNEHQSEHFNLTKDKLKEILKKLKISLVGIFEEFLKNDLAQNKGDKISTLINALIEKKLMKDGSNYKSKESYYDFILSGLLSIEATRFLKELSNDLLVSKTTNLNISEIQEKIFSDIKLPEKKIIALLTEFSNFKGNIEQKAKEIIEKRDKLDKILTKKIYDIEFEDFSNFLKYSKDNLNNAVKSNQIEELNAEKLNNLIDFSQLFSRHEFNINTLETLNDIFYFFINLIDSQVNFTDTEETKDSELGLKTFIDFNEYQMFIESQKSDLLIEKKLKYSKFLNNVDGRKFNHLSILEINRGQ